jgi:hypothetical protein
MVGFSLLGPSPHLEWRPGGKVEFYWAPVASAPGSTAASRLIVRARLWKFPLVPPGAPRLLRERPLAGKGGTMREKCPIKLVTFLFVESVSSIPFVGSVRGFHSLKGRKKANKGCFSYDNTNQCHAEKDHLTLFLFQVSCDFFFFFFFFFFCVI